MKLTEIKKLKVAELRSRLREVGLDSGGLKAELVVRLWSALDSGLSARGEETRVEQQPDDSPTPAAPTDTVEDLAPSSSPPAAEACITAPCCPDSTRGFTDSGTQTEAESGVTAPQLGSELVSESVKGNQAELGGEVEGPGEERRDPSSEETNRGRAFYEFKEEIRYKRVKSPQPPVDREEAEEKDEDRVSLDLYDSHLHFEEEQEGVEPCGVRVGWSVAHSSLLLGEDELSFAYDGHSKKVSNGKEEEFGESFSEGDIVGCYASFSAAGAVQISFHKNGRFIGVAFSLGASVLQGRPLIPHILCKSCSVRFLLDPTAPPWYPSPPGFTPLAALPAGQRVRSTLGPSSRAQCEVLLMMGLPGSGKSHWARSHMKQHPEKRYRLLGTEELLACTISGEQRDSRLRQAAQCLTDLIKIAAQTPGNYILDQCNILFSARRHKLQLFSGYRRRAVVVFPPADEWRRRLSLHQTSEEDQIPETALLKLQVSCSLPERQTDLLEELLYVDLPQEQAQTLLQEYKDCARRLLPPVPKKEKKRPRLHRKRPLPHGPPPSHRIQWTGMNAWNNPRINMQPWSQHPTYWNVSYRDQSYNYSRDFAQI
ncbi:unnamed protein product [Pleuronectes platessa]|uniref:SAP domain-containing protein n=1 Tax=Pleuronectes platessa TaxID=8262 RepID=A0A9N7Y5K0_PLEPL|nr:unnamed protein product [Pleuronectes platessa]